MAVVMLAGCAEAPIRYTVPSPIVGETIRIAYRSVEVRDVSLPTYAASDEIHVEGEDGALQSSTSVLWADNPERAVSLALARNLAEVTKAKVANEPWPFESFAQARVEVRIEQMLASKLGVFRLQGQYFVSGSDDARERSGLFELSRPYDFEAGPRAIAAARGEVILELAREIARSGLR